MKENFVKEYKLKIDSTIESLIEYKLRLEPKNKLEIEKFFKFLGESSKNYEFDRLKYIGEEYQRQLDKFQEVTRANHEYFSVALEGLARVKNEIRTIEQEFSNSSLGTQIGKEYINMTSNGQILIIDDDAFILSILSKSFEMNGYDVIVTSNPHEAIEMVKSGNIDLAIVDIIMPELDGFQVLDKIKAEKVELPVIFITGRDYTETKVDALKRGVEDYIVKPFNVEEVMARVESVLKRNNDYKTNVNVDELTGAYTRKHFISKINQYSQEASKGRAISIGFLDLDKFKQINDVHGHLIGDKILKLFVEETKAYLKESKIFRFGGDEFLIVLEDKTESQATTEIEALRVHINKMDNHFESVKTPINIGLSIGITKLKSEDKMLDILDRADKALYCAKERGRNRVIAYSEIAEFDNLDQKSILILDMENVASNLVRSRLKSLGYDVNLVNNQMHMPQSIPESLDLLIIDFKTYENHRTLLDKKLVNNSKILMVVSEQEKHNIGEYSELKVDDYIAKPFSVIEIEKKIRRLL